MKQPTNFTTGTGTTTPSSPSPLQSQSQSRIRPRQQTQAHQQQQHLQQQQHHTMDDDYNNNNSAANTSASANTTPTASRARKNGRRIQVWMKQQWRQRNIPIANFNNTNNTVARISSSSSSQVQAQAAPSSSSQIRSGRGINNDNNNIKTPTSNNRNNRNRNNCTTPVASASASRTRGTFQNFETFPIQSLSTPSPSSQKNKTKPLTTSSPGGTIIVSNVDEALEALTSQYKFEHTQFSIIAVNNDGNSKEYTNNDDDYDYDEDDNNNDIVDNYDWILDGYYNYNNKDKDGWNNVNDGQYDYNEQQQQNLYTIELMRQMYPTTTTNSATTTSNNNNNLLLKTTTTTENAGSTIPTMLNINDADEEEEINLMILKYGSVMGQQEYQFASFDDFNNHHANLKNVGRTTTTTTNTTITATDETSSPKTPPPPTTTTTNTTDDYNDDDATTETIAIIKTTTAAAAAAATTTNPLHDNDVEKQNNSNNSTTSSSKNSCNKNHNHDTATTNTTTNFETFWQDAIDAPTPDTGTFPSIDSRSTYVTSPILNMPSLSSPSLFQQQQRQQQDQDQDVSILSSSPPPPNDDVDDDKNKNETDSFCDFQTAMKNSSFETAPLADGDEYDDDETRSTPNNNNNMHTGITPLKKNGRGDDNDDEDDHVDAVRSSLFSSNSLKDDHKEGPLTPRPSPRPSPPPPQSSSNNNEKNNEYQQEQKQKQSISNRDGFVARSLAGDSGTCDGAAEQPTPVIRNYQYIVPPESNNYNNNNSNNNNNDVLLSKSTHDDGHDDNDDDNTRTTPPPPSRGGGGRRMMVVPKTIMGTPERFRLADINNVMNGVVADDDDDDKVDNDNLPEKKEEEETSKVSLWAEEDESTCNQSSSIPSVVQLFTKSIKSDQSKTSIVVPTTVRTRATATTTTVPSFYSGKNSFLYDNVTPSSVASASASLMSMKMMMSENNASFGGDGGGGGGGDEPSITSSLASPEGKFFRRRTSQSKLFRQKEKRRLEYQRSRSSNNSNSNDDDNNDDDDDEFTYEDDGDSDDDDNDDEDSDELDDEESLSLGSISTLPNQYWKHPELDHTLQELMKLEWDWLPYWQMKQLVNFDDDDDNANCCNTDNVPLLQEQITDRLSKLDAFYGKICKKVYRKIQPHAEELVSANEAALQLQSNLQLSQMNLIRSQKSIELAKCGRIMCNDENENDKQNIDDEGVGIYGAIRLLDLWDTQESYLELNNIEILISELCDLEFKIAQLIENFDTYKSDSLEECDVILSLVEDLNEQLQDEPVNRLVCFDDARERTAKFVSETFVCRLHVCLADIAVEWCHSSDSTSSSALFVSDNTNAYSRLIQAMNRVKNHHHDQHSSTEIDTMNTTLISDICTSIQTALLLEAQKAFGRSLLDPTDSENEKSDYEQELVALSNNENYLDSMRLPIWTHNLVTIRFEFEMKQEQKTPLPAVFHKLCLLLTNVLCGMYHLIEWHSKKNEASSSKISETIRSEIFEQLQTRRASIWNSCIQSMEECLEEYLKYSGGKRTLFSLKENKEHDDSKWREDLEGIHDVSVLTNQFLSLGSTFLEGISKDVVNDGSMIEERILSCSKTHLRSFHVDAMNTLGTMLYREDWQLHSLTELETENSRRIQDAGDESSKKSLDYIVQCISGQLFHQGDCRSTQNCRSRCNMFSSMTDVNILAENRNPFEIERESIEVATMRYSKPTATFDSTDEHIATILQLLRNYIGDDDARSSNIMLRCIHDGILPWTARLLVMIDRLPSLVEAACEVLINIFDLYATTAFRLCSGNAINERILLGIDNTFQKHAQDDDYSAVARDNRSASPMFDFGLRSKATQMPNKYTPLISATAEAELCTLVPDEHNDLGCLREFLMDSQKRLQGVAKLDLVDKWISDPTFDDETIGEEFAQETARVLEKRQAASCNHIFLAIGLYIATKSISTSCEKMTSYTYRVLQSFPLLMSLCNRISCMRSIRGKALLTEIVKVGSVWEESKLHEQSNEYVEDFCDFLALIWYYLYTCSGSRLTIGILKILWENLVGAGYMVLLDGFSKVPYCSTEGRSLMSMDVATYYAGVSARSIASRLDDQPRCPLPTNIQPYRTMSYVNTYIKLFYFPPDDALDWIKSNFKLYHQHHVLALVSGARDAKNLSKQVMDCYRGKKDANTIRI